MARVTFVTDALSPTCVPIFDEVSRLVDGDFHAVYLHTADPLNRGWGDLLPEHPHEYLPVGRLRRLWRIIQLFAMRKPEVVCCYGYNGWEKVLVLMCCRMRAGRLVTRSDSNVLTDLAARRWKRIVKWAYIRAFVGRGTRVWTIGDLNADYWNQYGLDNQVRIPYRAARPPLPDQPFEDSRWTGSPTYLFVGRLVANVKGLEELVSAWSAARSKLPPGTRLVVVGHGPFEEVLRRECAGFPEVVFTGAVPHARLGDWFGKSECLILPSRYEPWGLVVNEAMGNGCWVIASDVVGAAHDLIDDSNGRVFPVGDTAQLTQAILDVSRLGPRLTWQVDPFDTAQRMVEDVRTLLQYGLTDAAPQGGDPGDAL